MTNTVIERVDNIHAECVRAEQVVVTVVKAEQVVVEESLPWCRKEWFLERGIPENLLYAWAAKGDVRMKKVDPDAPRSAAFFRKDDVIEALEKLPNAKTKKDGEGHGQTNETSTRRGAAL